MPDMRSLINLLETALVEARTIHLEPNMVPRQLRAGYTGTRFKAEVTERVTIPSHAGNWDGGARDTYTIVRTADGSQITASDNSSAPDSAARRDRVIDLQPGIAVVRHTMFNGKDMGLTFYVHPSDAAALLPSSDSDVSEVEKKVLNIVGGFKSGYRDDERRHQGISDADYAAARNSLFQKGMLDKRGAITVAGRNARK